MTFKRNLLAQAMAAALIQVFVLPVSAQEAAQAPEEEQEAPSEARAATLDKVIVTGSRIRRAGFDTLEPATVITREAIEVRGFTNLADAINEGPSFGIGATPEAGQSSFGVGVNFANQFGLGTARTLTLINGRRVVSSNTPTIFGPAGAGLQVDLNIIPVQWVDRVENLTVGGAPTYGSDAIAGVINIITRRDYEGAEISSTYGITDSNDTRRENISAAAGSNFANGDGNFMITTSFDSIDPTALTSRKWGRNAFSFRTNPCASTVPAGRDAATDGRVNTDVPFQTCSPSAATDGIPNQVLIRDDRFNTFTAGGLLLGTGLQFDGNGDLVPFAVGNRFGANASSANSFNSSGGDGFNLAETSQLTSGIIRRNATIDVSYQVAERTRLFFEGLFYDANSEELIDQPIFNINLFGGQSAPITFSADNPLLSQQNRDVLAAAGITSFRLSRASRDLVTNNARAETELQRFVFGLDGDFDVGSRTFYWEASVNYGDNDSRFFQTVLNQQNFINSLNVAEVNGQIVCTGTPIPGLTVPGGNTPRADANCVPLNLFGEGRPSDAARNYVTDETITETQLQQKVFNVSISGDLFDIWGGPVAFSAGAERRIEKGSFQPDFFQANGLGRAVPITPTLGSFSTNEVFAELLIPLVDRDADLPLLKRFDLTGKYRHVDSTVNGGFDAYTVGFQWEPFADLQFRGNFTRSLRAPAITELFTPSAEIFTAVPDPCDTRNVASGTRPDVRQANCAAFYQAFGLDPNDFTSVAVNATIRGATSGDPNLENESSDAYTAGLVFQPSFISGLRMAVDYYKIDISNTIANLNAAAIATGCFDNTNFNTGDVANANSFCSRIRRTPDGQIDFIQTGFVNGGFLDFTGWTAEIAYSKNLAEWGFAYGGDLSLVATGFKTTRLQNSINNVVTNDDKGELGNSEHRGQLTAAYNRERWGFNWQVDYQDGAVISNDATPESRDINGTSSYWLHNAGVRVKVLERGSLRLAVTNVFDKNPPIPTLGLSAGVFDILGRRYSLTFNWKF